MLGLANQLTENLLVEPSMSDDRYDGHVALDVAGPEQPELDFCAAGRRLGGLKLVSSNFRHGHVCSEPKLEPNSPEVTRLLIQQARMLTW